MHHKKIPKSNRHKKLKAIDPFYRGERKQFIDRKASRANEKPGDGNIQEVPRKMRELIKIKDLVKEGKYTKAMRRGKRPQNDYNDGDDYGPGVKGCDRKPQTIPVFKQKPHENAKAYANRVKRMTQDIVAGSKIEAKFDADFDVNVNESDNSSGDEGVPDRFKGEKKPRSEKKLAKRKVFQEKEKEKKRHKYEERALDTEEVLTDYVPFGEVAMQPPSLTALPRKASKQNPAERKPASKPMLLTQLFDSAKSVAPPPKVSEPPPVKGARTGKRKHLAIADRRILEQERDAAVQAYRAMKKKRTTE